MPGHRSFVENYFGLTIIMKFCVREVDSPTLGSMSLNTGVEIHCASCKLHIFVHQYDAYRGSQFSCKPSLFHENEQAYL
jgi:hypothetical protein